jgi:hypothetical protein
VKAKGTEYLPALEGMSATAVTGIGLGVDPVNPVTGHLLSGTTKHSGYTGYITRAMFYPAMGRTVMGLIGLLFSKPPTPPEVPEAIQKQFNDVSLTGQSLHGFGVEMAREILVTGRVGVLVDYAEKPLSEEENRPYWLIYTAEDIINWKAERIGGKMLLTLVVLKELIDTEGDEFSSKRAIRYRVLRLIDGPTGLTYTVQLYTENPEKKEEFVAGPVTIPVRRGDPLDFIPFQFVGPTTLSPEIEHPPMVDLADTVLSHYRTSADREHGAHFTALPTPWIKGYNLAPGETLGVGSGTAWVFPSENAAAGMLEFSGAGLGSLAAIMEEKRLLMATLGARMLETQKNTQEAAQTVAMRHAGEGSALGIMADTLGKALSNLAAWHLYWTGREKDTIKEEQQVTLNPELLEQLTSEDIAALTALWQAGGISKRTLYYNLQWGEWTRPDIDFEQEQEDIEDEEEDEEPPLMPLPGQPLVPGQVPPKPGQQPVPPVESEE